MSYIAAILSVVGLWFNARKSVWCWPVWFVGNALWVIAYVPRHDWAVVGIDAVMMVLNVVGWFHWRKTR